MKKKIIVSLLFCCACLYGNAVRSQSIDPVSLIIAKVIKAIDLKVQRLQNQTLVSQVAQQAAEQALSKKKLSEITGWQEQLSKMYDGYFSELKQVKSTIVGGSIVKKILSLQQQVVVEYGRLGKEIGIKPEYDASLNSGMEIMQMLQVALSSQLSMRDAERICVLQTLKDAMYHCLESMQSLNTRQMEMISNRTRLQADLDYVKRLHGLKWKNTS
ncbi:MAG: hypothetical protein ABI581_05910 [Sediminibacterium sp.]